MSDSFPALQLAVALDGGGRHPAARRAPRARELFTARYRSDLVTEAEHGLAGPRRTGEDSGDGS
ncbi:hypothetical protein ABZT47_27585 [Sphaerisporangium sp. NPDC005289]|uniref:hypothetical protein n=1 Tax=Sphaerisporangium sp. NPDC005289 TaxID=3155247 RepID=UPI0033B29B30